MAAYCYLTLSLGFVVRDSANAVPTIRNCTPEFPTFGGIAKVNPDRGVQWPGLALGEPPE